MGFWSSITGSSGISKAKKASDKGFKNAKNFVLQGQEKVTSLLAPGAGYQPAQNALERLLGLAGPQEQEKAFGEYRESPGVSFMRDQGEQSLQRAAAAGGQLAAGRTLADANKFGQGVAEQGFGDFYNRLAQLYGTKLNTAGNLANSYGGTYNSLADLAFKKGQARAGFAERKGNILPGIIGDGFKIGADLLGRAISPFGGGSSYSPSQ